MKEIIFVFIGGGAGSACRYLFSRAFYMQGFPAGTLISNLVSCLVLGLLLGALDGRRQDLYLLVAVGFCGGLSTFSSFSKESLDMLKTQQYVLFAFYAIFSFSACLAALLAGMRLWKWWC